MNVNAFDFLNERLCVQDIIRECSGHWYIEEVLWECLTKTTTELVSKLS